MSAADLRPRHHVERVMGMAVSIDVRSPVSSDAIDRVVAWLHHVDATFSTYRLDSPVSRLGLGDATLDEMPDEVIEVLVMCEELTVDTDGAFDVLAVRAPNGSLLDPSGYVKGWSLQRAAQILVEHGAGHFCINGGGDVVAHGAPEPGSAWRIGVRHPDEPSSIAAVVAAAGPVAVATSGSYERGAHIVDPRTGAPVTDLASATVVGTDLALVDACATAVYVMGVDGLRWLLERHPDLAGLVITRDDRVLTTPNFADLRGAPVSGGPVSGGSVSGGSVSGGSVSGGSAGGPSRPSSRSRS